MFKPSGVLEEAVTKKDIVSIKSSLCFIINSNQRFSDFDSAVEYVESKGISIKEPYRIMEEEYTIDDKSGWTNEYFYYKTRKLEENFAVAERLPHIKAIAQSVFAEKNGTPRVAEGSPRVGAEKKGCTVNPKPAPSKSRRSKKKNTISIGQAAGTIAAIIAIAGIIIWIIKAFR